MSRIQLRRSHDLSAAAARKRVDRMATALGRKENVLDARLGFLLAMFRDRVDAEIAGILDKEFPEGKA
jgi:hypothetical protein